MSDFVGRRFSVANEERILEEQNRIRSVLNSSLDTYFANLFGFNFYNSYSDSYISPIHRTIVDDTLKNYKNMYVSGDIGVGKTTLLLYTIKRILAKRIEKAVERFDDDFKSIVEDIAYFHSVEFTSLLLSTNYEYLLDLKYLFIDDFGTERTANDLFISRFDFLVDASYRSGFPIFFITSNLNFEFFRNNSSFARAFDRLGEKLTLIVLEGLSYRRQG